MDSGQYKSVGSQRYGGAPSLSSPPRTSSLRSHHQRVKKAAQIYCYKATARAAGDAVMLHLCSSHQRPVARAWHRPEQLAHRQSLRSGTPSLMLLETIMQKTSCLLRRLRTGCSHQHTRLWALDCFDCSCRLPSSRA